MMPTTLDVERALKRVWSWGYELTVLPGRPPVFIRVRLPWWTAITFGLAQTVVRYRLLNELEGQPVCVEVV